MVATDGRDRINDVLNYPSINHLEMISESYPDDVTQEELEEDIYIEEDFENEVSPILHCWYGVSTPTLSIIAYFGDRREAERYKKRLIKAILKSKR